VQRRCAIPVLGADHPRRHELFPDQFGQYRTGRATGIFDVERLLPGFLGWTVHTNLPEEELGDRAEWIEEGEVYFYQPLGIIEDGTGRVEYHALGPVGMVFYALYMS